MIIMGIDPGVNNGLAVKQPNNAYELKTLSFWKLIREIDGYRIVWHKMIVYIEDSTQISPVFPNRLTGKNVRTSLKIAQHIGSNKRTAQLLFDYFDLNGIKYHKIRPTKNSLTKVKKERFEKISGYKGRSSEHSRDACCLILGR